MLEQEFSLKKLFTKYYKLFILTTVISATIAIILSLLLPKKYSSNIEFTATNSQYTDKSFLNGENLQSLISIYGGAEDNNRLMSLASSEKICSHLLEKFDLAKIYKIDDTTNLAKFKLLNSIKKDIKIKPTEKNTIEITVTANKPKLAAEIANEIAKKTNEYSREVTASIYNNNIKALTNAIDISSKTENKKLIAQYEAALKAELPALIVLSEATPQYKPTGPKLLTNIMLSILFSIAFCMVLIFVKQLNK